MAARHSSRGRDARRSPHDVLHSGQHGSGTIEGPDFELLAAYVSAQCAALLERHSFEDFLTVRTLCDYCQHAAWEAKRGNLGVAQSEVAALRKMAPSDEELTLAFRVSFDAVQSLIDWKRGSHQQAAESLKSAIHAAAELAARFGHGYLTGRRIYLATNMARIELSDGKVDQALYLCQALGEVIKGDASRWPFGAARSLSLPLSPLEEAFLQEHLDRLLEESLARGAWPADRTA